MPEPIGSVIAYAAPLGHAAQDPPVAVVIDSWVLCNGAQVPREGQFAALHAVIHESYGAGDGATTFTLPDYRGYFLRAADLGAFVDDDVVGRQYPHGSVPIGNQRVGTRQDDSIHRHTH